MLKSNYHEEKKNELIEKTREMCSQLPPYVGRFVKSIQQNTEVRTRYEYVKDLKRFFEFLCKVSNKKTEINSVSIEELSNLSRDFFDDYMDYLELYKVDGKEYSNGKKSIKRKMSSLRRFMTYLFKEELINVNNIEKVETPKVKRNRQITYMDRQEAANFLNCVNKGYNLNSKMAKAYHEKLGLRDLALTTLMLYTGIRVSECAGLDIDDVDLENSRITIFRKGGYTDNVYFSENAKEILSEYIELRERIISDSTALFLSTRNDRLSVRAIEAIVTKYAKKAVPMKHITCHKLRSSYGTALFEETGDIYLTAEVLGHKDINTTSTFYSNLSDAHKRGAKDKVSYDTSTT